MELLLGLGALGSVIVLTLPAVCQWCWLRGVWKTVIVCRCLVGTLAVFGALPLLGSHDRPSNETEWEMAYAACSLILLVIALLPVVVLPIALELTKVGFGEERRRHGWWPVLLLMPVGYLAAEVVWFYR